MLQIIDLFVNNPVLQGQKELEEIILDENTDPTTREWAMDLLINCESYDITRGVKTRSPILTFADIAETVEIRITIIDF